MSAFDANVALIAAKLKEIQEAETAQNHVVFSSERSVLYAQFGCDGGESFVYGEIVGNNYLPPGSALGMGQVHKLLHMGWDLGDKNFFRTWLASSDASREKIARELLAAMIDVQGLDPDLTLEATLSLGNEEAKGNGLGYPAGRGPVPDWIPKAHLRVAEIQKRVLEILAQMAEHIEASPDGLFSFPFDTTRVFARVLDADGAPIVAVWAVTNVDVPASPELYEFVAKNADNWLFGHLGAKEESGKVLVALSHRFAGDFLDAEEFRGAVGAIAVTARQIDGDIKEKFGGRLIVEPESEAAKGSSEPPVGAGYL
jgi:hypothetical protein